MTIGDIGSRLDWIFLSSLTLVNPSLTFGPTDIALVAARGLDGDGFVWTFSCDDEGSLGSSMLDSWEFNTSGASDVTVRHVNGNIYVILYRDGVFAQQLITFEVANNGTITKSTIDTDTIRTSPGGADLSGYPEEFYLKSANSFFFSTAVYGAPVGRVGTIAISDGGAITDGPAPTISMTYDGSQHRSCQVSGEVWVTCYRTTARDLFIETYDFTSKIDIFEIDPGMAVEFPRIMRVRPNVFVVVFQGTSDDGYLWTVTIADNGSITKTGLKWLEFETDFFGRSELVYIAEGVIAICYHGASDLGWIKTYPIAADRTIGSIIDTLEFWSSAIDQPEIHHKAGNVYAIVHEGSWTAETVDIETLAASVTHHEMIIGVGP